jgi:hypothetical protein
MCDEEAEFGLPGSAPHPGQRHQQAVVIRLDVVWASPPSSIREFNLSESTFVLPSATRCTRRVRILTSAARAVATGPAAHG